MTQAVAVSGQGAVALAQAVRSGQMASEALVRAALTAVVAQDGEIHACAATFDDTALQMARRIDAEVAAGRDPGPLAGVPFLVKHNLDVAGYVSVAGSPTRLTHAPATHDAEAVARLRAAGAVPIGATHMDELACGATGENPHFGSVHLPQDTARMTGGSSSGSAAAVAAGYVPLALGTDTNGSIRAPAALCGVWGWRPTHGGVSTAGCVPYAHTLDTVGGFARTIDDLTTLWQVLADPPAGRVAGEADRVWRVGVLAGDFHARADADQQAAVAAAGGHFGGAEAVVIDDEALAQVRVAAVTISNFEVARAHGALLQAPQSDVSLRLRQRLEMGQAIADDAYEAALACREAWRARMRALFDRFDILLAPATPYVAPRFDTPEVTVNGHALVVAQTLGMFTLPISFAGLPVVTAPMPRSAARPLPVGIQIIAAEGADATAFAAARHLQAGFPAA